MSRAQSLKACYATSPQVGVLLVLATLACGSESAKRKEAAEREQQRLVASAARMKTFADRNGVESAPVFDDYDNRTPESERYTLRLQERIEGKRIAFRANLSDIARIGTGRQELVLTDGLGGTTIVRLTFDGDVRQQVPALDPDDDLLVAAEILRVAPMTIRAEPCSDEDCEYIELHTDGFDRPRIITGKLIALEKEPRDPGRRLVVPPPVTAPKP